MNITMKLTFDGLVRALRWKAFDAGETVALERHRLERVRTDADDIDMAIGGKHDERSSSIAEGPV